MRPFISPRRGKGLITLLALYICLGLAFARPSDVVITGDQIKGPNPTVEPFKAPAVLAAPKEDGNRTADKITASDKRYINLSNDSTFLNPKFYFDSVINVKPNFKNKYKTKNEIIHKRKPISYKRINNKKNSFTHNILKPVNRYKQTANRKQNKNSILEWFKGNAKNKRFRRETHYSFGRPPNAFRQKSLISSSFFRRFDNTAIADDLFHPIRRNLRKYPNSNKKKSIFKIDTANHYESTNSNNQFNLDRYHDIDKKTNIVNEPKIGLDHLNALKKWKTRLKPLGHSIYSTEPTLYSSSFSSNFMNGARNITNKKTAIHQIYTKWSEKSNFEDILNINDKVNSSFYTFTNNKTLFNNLPQSNIDKIQLNDVVYIRPKPFTNQKVNNIYNKVVKPTVSSGISAVDRFNKHTTLLPNPSPIITYAGWPQSNNVQPGPSIIIKKPIINIQDVPQKIITPRPYDIMNSIPTTAVYHAQDPDRPDPSSSNEDKFQINSGNSDCPTVYITLNNTFSQAKEACPDYNIMINSHLINKNIIKDEDSESTEESSDSEGPDDPYGIKSEEVSDQEAESPNLNSGYIPVEPSNYQQATISNYGSASQGSGTNPLAVNPAPRPSKPTRKPKPAQESDDDSSSMTGWFNSLASFATWTTLLNPFGFGFWPLLISPVILLFAGGVGFATIFAPWAFPTILDRKAKTVFRIHDQPTKWQWDSGHKTWNWASFPNDREWKDVDPRSGPNFGVTGNNALKTILKVAYDSVVYWTNTPSKRNKSSLIFIKFFYDSITNIASNFDSWKKRRKY